MDDSQESVCSLEADLLRILEEYEANSDRACVTAEKEAAKKPVEKDEVSKSEAKPSPHCWFCGQPQPPADV